MYEIRIHITDEVGMALGLVPPNGHAYLSHLIFSQETEKNLLRGPTKLVKTVLMSVIFINTHKQLYK